MIIHKKAADIEPSHKNAHKDYEYFKRDFVPRGTADGCVVSIYEIPPKKSAYPYHYHLKNEETFYIISGEGVLKTPEGEEKVEAGDFLFFPADESGAHKLTNTSDNVPLVYIDFDTSHDVDLTMYPESGKIGVWGKNVNKVYRHNDNVDYYDGK